MYIQINDIFLLLDTYNTYMYILEYTMEKHDLKNILHIECK